MLIDPRAVVREGLRAAIAQEPDLAVVAQAPTVIDATSIKVRPDVIITDLSATDTTSENDIAALRNTYPLCPILAFAPVGNRATIETVFAAGANGYLLETATTTEILEAIRTVARGETYVRGCLETEPNGFRPPRETICGLTPQEQQVLHLLVLGHTNAEVALQCGVSLRTAEARRANLQRKLGRRTRAELVAYTRESNLFDAVPTPRRRGSPTSGNPL